MTTKPLVVARTDRTANGDAGAGGAGRDGTEPPSTFTVLDMAEYDGSMSISSDPPSKNGYALTVTCALPATTRPD